MRLWIAHVRRCQRNERTIVGALKRRRPRVLGPAIARWRQRARQLRQFRCAKQAIAARKARREHTGRGWALSEAMWRDVLACVAGSRSTP